MWISIELFLTSNSNKNEKRELKLEICRDSYRIQQAAAIQWEWKYIYSMICAMLQYCRCTYICLSLTDWFAICRHVERVSILNSFSEFPFLFFIFCELFYFFDCQKPIYIVWCVRLFCLALWCVQFKLKVYMYIESQKWIVKMWLFFSLLLYKTRVPTTY